jgi:hypothetical protein
MKPLKNRGASKTQEFFKYYPDPAIFIIDLQDTNTKTNFVNKVFLHILLFEGTFTSFFKDKK